MLIDWIGKKTNTSAITIYENNIVLNKQAADYFEDAYFVLVGIDRDTNNLVIKNISKEEASNSSEAQKNHFHKITFTRSYGRISGKQMIDEIKTNYNLSFKGNNTYKYSAVYNTGSKMLIIDLNKGERK